MYPRITIVGRPNVGKSSLFNIITGHRIAIVSDIENTTRDIVEYDYRDEENETIYTISDSGGLVDGDDDTILKDVRERTEEAIKSSDIILFALEYDKITTLDEHIAKKLRRSKKPVIVLANKADNPRRALEGYELMRLGWQDIVMTSPSQNRGIGTLRKLLADKLKEMNMKIWEVEEEDVGIKLAIIGRPNVGKSSLVNAISGETRSIVRDMPGTTRDTIDTIISHDGTDICLIDTAGIRRGGKIGSANIEQWSVLRAERAIERADIVAVVMDADEGITHQDQHIVGRAIEEKKGIILVVNKWDKILSKKDVAPDILERYMKYLANKFDFLSYVPVVFTSAIDGKRIDRVLEHTVSIYAERAKRVKTGVFNTFLDQIVHDHAPTGNRKSHKPKIYYGSQVDSNPPKFLISVNKAEHFHFSYKRYIENKIREFFGFEGTPIDVEIRGRLSIYKKENRHGNKTVIHKDDSEKHTDERERADREKAKRAPKTAEEKKKILKKRSVTKGKGSAKKGEEE